MERQIPFGLFQCGVDYSAGHAESAVLTEDRTDGLALLYAMGCGVFEAHFFENPVDVLDDGFEVLVVKRMVPAAAFTGPHRLHGFFQRRGPLSMSRLPASRTSRHCQVPPKAGQRLPGNVALRAEKQGKEYLKNLAHASRICAGESKI